MSEALSRREQVALALLQAQAARGVALRIEDFVKAFRMADAFVLYAREPISDMTKHVDQMNQHRRDTGPRDTDEKENSQ